jgi:hypothetical protein
MNGRHRTSIIGEASEPLSLDDDPRIRAVEGRFASRVYRCFLRLHEARVIAPQIPRIARSLGADEDCVWDLFVHYFRGVDEPWRA